MAHLPDAIRQLAKVETEHCDVSFGTREPCTVAEHTHETTNYGTITEGCLFLTLNGEERAYGKGDWFHVPADAPHIERFEQTTSVVVFWIK